MKRQEYIDLEEDYTKQRNYQVQRLWGWKTFGLLVRKQEGHCTWSLGSERRDKIISYEVL